ncbi:MAG: cytochrome c [Gammaproteobacteria bacterium]|nr:cytochrome c [Gammaproteobacteria bacterium]NIR31093.1 cytochrome c [Gammaproteobacteria bacterium]NIT64270.1 cytochrome c [Gammaproteobacteria bacterium]NIY32850.1 cytochrome c [Gammaproteobacteria bacterium]
MNAVVEGNARKLADAAERGDMAEAAGYISDIVSGCVACHHLFRGRPGRSPHLGPPPASRE